MEKQATDHLTYQKTNFYEAGDAEAAYAYAEGYKAFLDAAKTEREAVRTAIALCEQNGFTEYHLGDPIAVGDKKYLNNRGKNLFVFSVGSEDLRAGIRLTAAHVDSPRLDLKQCPLYEEGGMAFFKTHYYGGIRKYQWVATPLSLHGVVALADGRVVDICIGEDEGDPQFYINDLLPHLGHKQGTAPLDQAIEGEKLNILVGSRPLDGETDDPIKRHVLYLLNEKYGITEEDFLSAEISAVPAAKARDIGFDRSLVGAYGHDDRVCAYPALTALFESVSSPHTTLCILADKEETGSDGPSGMQGELLIDLINELSAARGVNPAIVRANTKCVSADVSAAYDPNFADVFEKRNSAMLSFGVVFNKYTGARGKSSTNDANAEYIGWLRGILAKDGVIWQTAELGKVDCGGGGTVAKYISRYNIDTIDIGVAVLSMHAPYEVIAKADLYEAHRAFSAFYRY